MFRQKYPSHYAAALIYAARKEEFQSLGILDNLQVWNEELEFMLNYTSLDIQETAERILDLQNRKS